MFDRPPPAHVFEGRLIFRHVLTPTASPTRRLVVAALAALTGLLAFAIFSAFVHGNAIDAQVRALGVENARLQQQIDERRTQIGEANNRDWLQEQARKLGFVFPGETIYILTTPGAAGPATGGLNAVLPTYSPTPVVTPAPSSSAAATSSTSAGPSAPAPPYGLILPSPTPH